MKQTFTKVLFLVFTISVFGGCVAKSASSKDELAKSTPYEFKEVSSEKQVLVYDKTISLPDNVNYVQFSPTNEDEVAVSFFKTFDNFSSTNHYATVDLKSGKVKKDIKLDNEKEEDYSNKLDYLDDGKKLYFRSTTEKVFKNVCETNYKAPKVEKKCKDRYIREPIKDKYNIFDLQTGELSSYYNRYNCDELIPKEFKKDGIEAYCKILSNTPKNKAYYIYTDKINKKSGRGIAIYDKDSFKPRKIITGDGKLDTEFDIKLISEDGQYVLFEGRNGKGMVLNSDGKVEKRKYIVYDLKNEKILHKFYSPFTVWGGGTFFIDKDTLVFNYSDGGIDELSSGKKINKYMGIINLNTNEKKNVYCDNNKWKCPFVQDIYNLNSRYMIWQFYSGILIFDKKELKVVQEFDGVLNYTVNKKFKKVAFVTRADKKILIYNIAQGE